MYYLHFSLKEFKQGNDGNNGKKKIDIDQCVHTCG